MYSKYVLFCLYYSGIQDHHETIMEGDISLDIPEDLFPADCPLSTHVAAAPADEAAAADEAADVLAAPAKNEGPEAVVSPAVRSALKPSTSFLNLLADS